MQQLSQSDERKPPPPDSNFWYNEDIDPFLARRSEPVTHKSVQKIATAYACVDVLSKTHAMLPPGVFKRTPRGGKVIQSNHPLYRVLRRPNAVMDRFQFWQLKERTQILRGNFYAQKMFNKFGQLVALHPIHPDKVTVREKSGSWDIEYLIKTPTGERVLSREEMFHTKEPGEDGIVGRSRIQIVSDAFGLALALQANQQALTENDSRPLGLLSPTAPLKNEEQKDKLRNSWEDTHGGPRRSGRVAVLPFGVEYKQISMTARDAQLLELMIHTGTDQVNTIFDVPPYRTQDFRRATFGNVEQSDIFWGKNSVSPRVICTEAAIEAQLLDPEDGDLFVKFNMDAMFRSDIKTRSEAYHFALTDGWLSRNEVREIEDWDPVENQGLDEFLAPMNYTTARGLLAAADKADKPQDSTPKNDPSSDSPSPATQYQPKDSSLARLLKDPVSRLATKEKRALIKCLKKETWLSECETFAAKHRAHMKETLGASIHAFFGDAVNSGDLDSQIDSIIEAHFNRRADEMTKTLSEAGRGGLTPYFEGLDEDQEVKKVIDFIVEGVKKP